MENGAKNCMAALGCPGRHFKAPTSLAIDQARQAVCCFGWIAERKTNRFIIHDPQSTEPAKPCYLESKSMSQDSLP